MVTSPPLPLPPWPSASDPMWIRAAQVVNALRAKGLENPAVVGGLANGYMESALKPKIAGDHDQSFSIWQDKWNPRGERIFAGTGIDLRTETSIQKIVDAVWYEIEAYFAPFLAQLKACKTAGDAARLWCVDYEMAGAANAADRRVLAAQHLDVWVAQNESFIAAHPAT